jgi:ankyrin repeat protein
MPPRKSPNPKQLFAAVDRRDPKLLQTLLQRGASKDATADFIHQTNLSILTYAASCQLAEAVEMLLNVGADPNAQSTEVTTGRKNYTALTAAICGSDVKKPGPDNAKRLRIVKRLIKAGAVLDVPDWSGKTALYHAAASGYDETVSELLGAGADAGGSNSKLLSPLIGASLNQTTPQEPIIKLLLERGSFPNCQDESGKTPLMLSSLIGSENAVRILLAAGSDVNQRSRRNETALIHAARYAGDAAMLGDHETAVRIYDLLLDAGADAQVRADPSPALPIGGTAIEIGLRSENPSLIDFLRKRFPTEAANCESPSAKE